MKPKIFIGSSVEAIEMAEAIQSNLEHVAYVTVWDQGVFNLSSTTLEDLLRTLEEFDYGLFIFKPDDKSTIRSEEYNVIRDNVIFELGLYFGKLGRSRVFYLIPRNYPKLHLPSDLFGVTAGLYDFERLHKDKNSTRAVVGPFCTQIKDILRNNEGIKYGIGIKRAALFNNFSDDFENLITTATSIDLFFIHSRQWRENNQNAINDFLKRGSSKLTVFLPNFLNVGLLNKIQGNFSDGKVIETLIKDAYTFFIELRNEYKGKVEIRSFDYYPTYSFYRFDNIAVVAMYPTTSKKKNVPSFKIINNSTFWNFLDDDLQELKKQSKKLNKIITQNL